MIKKNLSKVLGMYNFILAIGAFFTGIIMIRSNYGIFTSYPIIWKSKLPFESWTIPGIAILVIFGVGNVFAAVNCFKKVKLVSFPISIAMGALLLISLTMQVLFLGELYLATIELLIIGIIQIILAVFVSKEFYR